MPCNEPNYTTVHFTDTLDKEIMYVIGHDGNGENDEIEILNLVMVEELESELGYESDHANNNTYDTIGNDIIECFSTETEDEDDNSAEKTNRHIEYLGTFAINENKYTTNLFIY